MYFSDIFNISDDEFLAKGVFNARIDADSNLHIDPSLLKACHIPEFVGAYDEFRDYFVKVFLLLPFARTSTRVYQNIVDRLTFKEIANTCLGYSVDGTKGKGIGDSLAEKITKSVIEIFEIGIDNPVVIEMLPFFEDNIGPDRISDMTTKIIAERLLKYTNRVCQELSIKQLHNLKYHGITYAVPTYDNKPLVFVPNSILCDLPMARDWDDIDGVCHYNRAFRMRISNLIGERVTEVYRMPKRDIKKYLMQHPDVFNSFVKDWEKKEHVAYDMIMDRKNLRPKKASIFISYSWDNENHKRWVTKLANDLRAYFNVSIDAMLPLCADLNAFMEQNINKADKVLLILTEEYKRKADNRENGVGYETNIITNDLIKDNMTSKFIPIIRRGSKETSYPLYLGNKLGLDMSVDSCYEDKLTRLINDIKRYVQE